MIPPRDLDAKELVLLALRQRGVLTIDRLMAVTDLSKTATRSHLLRLEKDGKIARAEVESGTGRPPLAYRLTEQGSAGFPTDDGAVLSDLLRFLEDEGADTLVNTFFERVWAERMAEYKASLGARSLASVPLGERLEALEALLTTQQFMPVIKQYPGDADTTHVSIRECNCPLPAAARASRAPCRLEADFLSEVMGAPVRTRTIATNRQETCVFEFVVPEI